MICLICNEKLESLKSLARHLKYRHEKMSTKEYYDNFLKKEDEGVCHLEGCSNKTSYINPSRGYCVFCCKSHNQKSKQTRNKIKATNLLKYGKESSINVEKVKETKLKKYGDPNYNNRPKCAEKLLNRTEEEKEEWREKVRNAWDDKSEEEKDNIQDRREATCIKKHGDANHSVHQAKKAIKNKYGVDNISQTEEWKIKFKKTWSNKTKEELAIITNKKKETNNERYGYDHIMHDENIRKIIIEKSLATRRKNGNILPEDQISDFNRYKGRVYNKTNRNATKYFSEQELSKIGKCGIPGAHQIDHKYSIRDGFLNNVSPDIIASQHNLQIISWEENDTKKAKSCITLEECLTLYKDLKNGKNK